VEAVQFRLMPILLEQLQRLVLASIPEGGRMGNNRSECFI